jgi:aminoglycoside phosphotransferase (APT) family kinase protein
MCSEFRQEQIRSFLQRSAWLQNPEKIEFLAAGEYNANYLLTVEGIPYVLRINQGSQLGLSNQIEYEFRVLKALEESGVTPRAFYYQLAPDELEGGVLLMQYLPGKPLDYVKDMDKAAYIFARVHSVQLPQGLVEQLNPVQDILRECEWLMNRYPEHPLQRERDIIADYYQKIEALARENGDIFTGEDPCVVNTEVNSGNFLISEQGSYLVDWEKAVLSYRYQDLGHFLVSTTTRWKADYTYSKGQKQEFLRLYKEYAGLNFDLSELYAKTEIMEKTILLRALSWCYMAYYEYTRTHRAIRNEDTLAKIKEYLGDIQCILSWKE